jgi:DNA-binding helix-hairpin-helix protein with protein kinase domain
MIYKIEDKDGQIERCSFDLTHKIGEGATASVYKFIYKNEVWAAKIYHKDRAVNVDKLKAMLLQPPTDVSVEEGIQKYIQFTWVTYLIKDSSDAYIGFLMPFVDQDATNSLDTYYDPILIKRLKGIGLSALSLRIEIAIY